jgi:DNA polymerase-4/protein ImuB
MGYRPAAEVLIGCVRLPRFAVQVERWRFPELAAVPLALIGRPASPGRSSTYGSAAGNRAAPVVVVACSREAEAEGLRIGMPLREARAAAPDVTLREADPALYHQLLLQAAVELETITPLVEPKPPASLFLGLDGLVLAKGGLYQGPEELFAALERVVCAPWSACFGIGRGKFVAEAAARCPAETEPERILRSASGRCCWVMDPATFLPPLPVELLPVSLEMRRRLRMFGIGRLGQLVGLPLSALLAQFGKEGHRAWHLAHGRDDEPLRPYAMPLEIAETLQFADPVATLDPILVGARQLLDRALRRPERRGRGVRQMRLDAALTPTLSTRCAGTRSPDGAQPTWSQTVTVRQPGTLPDHLFPPLRYLLERARPPQAVEMLTLALTAFTASLGGQRALFLEPGHERREQLREEMRQLRTRFGSLPVARIIEVEPWSRLPENRYALISYDP